MAFVCGASSTLPIVDDKESWDGDAARRAMVAAGAEVARRGHLMYDDAGEPDVQATYKLPFAKLSGGDLKASSAGLRAAASRLPQTDAPDSVISKARTILDKYFKKTDKNRAALFDVSEDEHGGMMIALFIPKDVADELAKIPGVETKPEDMHITLAYMGKIDELDDKEVSAAILKSEKIARDYGPVEGEINGIGRFNASENSDGKDVLYAIFDSPTIDLLRNRLIMALRSVGVYPRMKHGFNPHVTLAYVDKGVESPIKSVPTIPVCCEELCICVGDKMKPYKFTGKSMLPKPIEKLIQFYHTLRSIFDDTTISREMAIQQVGTQVMDLLDKRNKENPNDEMNHHYLQDIYLDDNSQFFVITISGGRLFKWRIEIDTRQNVVTLGVPELVKPVFSSPISGRTTINKREDGRLEAFTVMSTATLNKDCEIDTRALFDSFIDRFRGDGSEYVNIYHIAGDASRIGELKSIFREEDLLVGYYVLDDNPISRKIGKTLSEDSESIWGGSIEFVADDGEMTEIHSGVSAMAYTSGTLLGYSIVKAAHGAAWGTEHYTRTEKMDKRNKELVLELVGGDQAALGEIEKWLDDRNARLKSSGAITRSTGSEQTSTETPDPTTEEVVEQTEGDVAEREIALDDQTLAYIVDAVFSSEQFMGLHQAVLDLAARVDAFGSVTPDETNDAEAEAEAENPQMDQMRNEMAALSAEVSRISAMFTASKPAQPQRERVTIKMLPENKPAPKVVTANDPQDQKIRWKPTGLFS